MAPFDPRRIPIVGDDIYQVGQVVDIIATPCSPEPVIMVQAFFAYTPQLLWSILKPDTEDLLLNRFKVRHKRNRVKNFRLSALDVSINPKPGNELAAVFKSIKFKERIGWYFLVADATTDFLVNWTSMVYEWSGCPVSGAPGATISTSVPLRSDLAAGIDQIGLMNDRVQQGWLTSGTTITANTIGPKQVTSTVMIRPYSGPGGGGTVNRVWLRRRVLGVNTDINLERFDDQDGSSQYTIRDRVFDSNFPAAQYTLWLEKTPGYFWIDTRFISGQGTLDEGYKPDP